MVREHLIFKKSSAKRFLRKTNRIQKQLFGKKVYKKDFFSRKKNKYRYLYIKMWRKPFKRLRKYQFQLMILRRNFQSIIKKKTGALYRDLFFPFKVNFFSTFFEKFIRWLDWQISVILYRLRIFIKYNIAILKMFIIRGITQVNLRLIYFVEYRLIEQDLLNICYLAYYRHQLQYFFKLKQPSPNKYQTNRFFKLLSQLLISRFSILKIVGYFHKKFCWYQKRSNVLAFIIIRIPVFQRIRYNLKNKFGQIKNIRFIFFYGRRFILKNLLYLSYFA